MVTEQKKSRAQTKEEARKRKRSARKEEKQTKRAEQKKQKSQKAEKKPKKPRKRIFPLWARIIVITILSVIALAGGLMVGYGIIGEGKPTDVLDPSTWQHIIDIVKTE
ncbi:hypothetical protein GCM10008986_10750 [Salinibacillus aidingensis]|uniref:DNA-directed RNA polymerase subunit beta n=1 Tax=Salinibacillus aidingensis TaxID=237684 RepID=A0ABN1AZF6_9BACI